MFQLSESGQTIVFANSYNYMFAQIVEYLLDMSEVVPDGQDSLTGETALTVAACNGCHTVCTTLLNRGANVSVPNQKVFPDDFQTKLCIIKIIDVSQRLESCDVP